MIPKVFRKGRWSIGVGFKLAAGIAVIVLLTEVSILLTALALTSLNDGLERLGSRSSRLFHVATRLYSVTKDMEITAQALLTHTEPFDLSSTLFRLHYYVAILEESIESLTALQVMLPGIGEMSRDVPHLLEDLDHLQKAVHRAAGLRRDLKQKIVDLDTIGLRLESLSQGAPRQSAVLLSLHHGATALLAAAAAAAASTEPCALKTARHRAEQALATAERKLTAPQTADLAAYRTLLERLQQLNHPANGVFATCEALTRATLRLRLLKAKVQGLLQRYERHAQTMLETSRVQFDRGIGSHLSLGQRVVTILILIGIVSVVGAAMLAAYIYGSILFRLKSLRVAVKRYHGGKPVSIPVKGEDEIAELGRGLRFFIDKIHQRERDLSESRDAAEAANRAKSAFLATMSHEIRTPINSIYALARLLEETRLDKDQENMVFVINNALISLLDGISDILDVSKMEAGHLQIETTPFDVQAVMMAVGQTFYPRASEKGLELLLDLAPEVPRFQYGDPGRIRQILVNLVGNAVKFTEEGMVTLVCTHPAPQDSQRSDPNHGRIRFEVRDTGIGITPQQQERLFRPFSQADSSTARRFGGTGLGLSICHRLVELMGGEIGADSNIGKGSVFWFTLPVRPAPQPHETVSADEAMAGKLIGKTVYICVDHVQLKAQICDFAKALGLTVVAAATTKDQLVETLRAKGGLCDLIILDRAVIQSLKGWSDLIHIWPDPELRPRFIRLTSFTARQRRLSQDRLQMLNLAKPLMRETLRAAVLEALFGSHPVAPSLPSSSPNKVYRAPSRKQAEQAGAMILIVEDNPSNRFVASRIMERRGFAFDMAEDGYQALRLMSRYTYGLLLTDFHMPGLDGFELTQLVRETETGTKRHMPVIALTADAFAETKRRCREAGMDEFLTKPIDPTDLEQALSLHLPAALVLRDQVNSAPPTHSEPPAKTQAADRTGPRAPEPEGEQPEEGQPEGLEMVQPEHEESEGRAPAADATAGFFILDGDLEGVDAPEAAPASATGSAGEPVWLDEELILLIFDAWNVEAYERLSALLDGLGGRIAAAQALLDSGDREAAGDEIHSLVGEVRTLGLAELGLRLLRLEKAVKREPEADLEALVAAVFNAAGETANEIHRRFPKTVAQSPD